VPNRNQQKKNVLSRQVYEKKVKRWLKRLKNALFLLFLKADKSDVPEI